MNTFTFSRPVNSKKTFYELAEDPGDLPSAEVVGGQACGPFPPGELKVMRITTHEGSVTLSKEALQALLEWGGKPCNPCSG